MISKISFFNTPSTILPKELKWKDRKVAIVATAALIALTVALVVLRHKSITYTACIAGAEAIGLLALAILLSKLDIKPPPPPLVLPTSDDEWGKLIDEPVTDLHERQSKLNKAAYVKQCPFRFHDMTSSSGAAAINNALGETAIKNALISHPETIINLLGTSMKPTPTKESSIANLRLSEPSKARAIHNYLGDASWFIGYNPTQKVHPMPRVGKTDCPIKGKQFFAARKDKEGLWWIIDKNNPQIIGIPLTLLHNDFVLIVPTK